MIAISLKQKLAHGTRMKVAIFVVTLFAVYFSGVLLPAASTAEPIGSNFAATADGSEKPTFKEKRDPALECTKDNCDLVKKYVNPIIGFLSAFVGIAVTIGIVSGGIRYASASDDPQKAAAGRQMIRNAIIALVAYIFLYAAFRWLVPQ